MQSIRTKFTFLYTLITTIIVAIFAVSSYTILSHNITNNLKNSIRHQSQEIVNQFVEVSDQTISLKPQDQDTILADKLHASSLSLRIIDQEKNIIVQLGTFKNQLKPSQSKINTVLLTGQEYVAVIEDESNKKNIYQISPIQKDNKIIGIIELSQPVDTAYDALNQLIIILAAGILLSIIISLISGYFLGRNTLSYVNELINNVNAITHSQDLEKRLPIPHNYNDELTRLASTFNQMLAKIEQELIREKNFTANVSHDLRTPLTIIQGNADLALRKKNLTPSQFGKIINTIKSETKRMDVIIGDLLDLSYLEHQAQTAKAKINFAAIVDEVVEGNKHKIQQANLNLTYKKPVDYRQFIFSGNNAQIKRLVTNLLDNAIKYNQSDGKIIIKLSAKNHQILFSIQDTGIGIQEKDLPYIFDRHFQSAKSQTGLKKGFGLGLSIVKEIINRHQGQIDIKSTYGTGTKLVMIFPQNILKNK